MTLQEALEAAGYETMNYAGKMTSKPCLGVFVRDSSSLIWLGYKLALAGVDGCDIAIAHCDAMRTGIAVYWYKHRWVKPPKAKVENG